MPKENSSVPENGQLSRREFLYWTTRLVTISGLSGLAYWLGSLLDQRIANQQQEQLAIQQRIASTAAVPVKRYLTDSALERSDLQPGNTINKKETPITLEPSKNNNESTQNTQEAPRSPAFTWQGIDFAHLFTFVLPAELNIDHPDEAVYLTFTTPLVNRELNGWDQKTAEQFANYYQYPFASLTAQTDLSDSFAIIIHAFDLHVMSAATASPGQENTPVPESVFHLPGEYWRIAANHQILLNKIIASVQKQKHVKMEVVGLHWVEGATFEASDRSPYDTKGKRYPDYPADKVTFFDTKQWNLPSDLRQTGFLYLVTCDGEYLPKTSYEYEKRLIVVLRPLEK